MIPFDDGVVAGIVSRGKLSGPHRRVQVVPAHRRPAQRIRQPLRALRWQRQSCDAYALTDPDAAGVCWSPPMLSTTAVAVLGAFVQAQPLAPAGPLDCSVATAAELRDSAVARFKEGEAALQESKWPQAEAALLKAVAFDPRMALAHYGLGQSYMELRRFPEAVQAFTTSREVFRCARAISDEERKRREGEILELREALRTADQQRLGELLARWKEANGDVRTPGDRARTVRVLEQRLAELESALKFGDPAPIGVTLALGTAHFQTGAIADAEREFRAVLARDPKSGDAHNNLALVCMLTGRLEEAEREMAAARKAGILVNPRLKEEIERRKREQSPPRF